MMCTDPNCTCQPAPRKQTLDRIQATLHGTKPNQTRQLHQQTAELEITCDMINHELTLRETVSDPKTPNRPVTQYDVHLSLQNSQLLNLEGLPDSSLLLSLAMRPEACNLRGHGLRLQTKIWSFRSAYDDSKLHQEFYLCDWDSMVLQLRLPASHIRGWKTVATFLLTFARVTRESWLGLVNLQEPWSVAGLNWRQIEKKMRSEARKGKCAKEDASKWDLKLEDA